uniref:Uncharacterized protein n=1 Tax=Nomascus leucogenys TaxID=61853 RepID=A0A2I3GYX4_NOMLE
MRQYTQKILVVLGSGGVGKSALKVQFVQGIFVEKYDPTIEDYYRKQVEVELPTVYAYTPRYSMRDLYMKNGQGFSTFDLQDLREQILLVKDTEDVNVNEIFYDLVRQINRKTPVEKKQPKKKSCLLL